MEKIRQTREERNTRYSKNEVRLNNEDLYYKTHFPPHRNKDQLHYNADKNFVSYN
jgi:hypothetical protein